MSARRLRLTPLRATLSLLGIASGVALIAAVSALSTSLISGSSSLDRALFADANLEAVARSTVGVDGDVLARVQRLRFVRWAAPLTSSSVTLVARRSRVDVQLIGLGGQLATHPGAGTPATTTGSEARVALPAAVADALSAHVGTRVWVTAGGRRRRATVARVLRSNVPTVLERAPIALATLPVAQQLTARPGTVDQLVIRTDGRPGEPARLQRLLSPRLLVRTPQDETVLVSQATQLDRLGVQLFGVISLIVGALLAVSAAAVGTANRRREAALMFAIGASRQSVLAGLVAEGLMLGVAGALLGLIGGDVVFDHVLSSDVQYLSSAFIIVPGVGLPLASAAIAALIGIATGVFACLIPSRAVLQASPAMALRGSRSSAVMPWRPSRRLVLGWLLAAAAICAAAVTTLLPGIAAVVAWLLTGLLLLPLAIPLTVALLNRWSDRVPLPLHLGIGELVDGVPRATAMAAVAGITICGIVLSSGTVRDIENGATRLAAADFGQANLWISDASASNAFLTRPLSPALQARAAATAGVSGVIPFAATFFDWRNRRLLVIGFRGKFSPTEIVSGSPSRASTAVAGGGAIALSQSVADLLGVGVGQRVLLATPAGPRSVTVAATTTNYGWNPGVISLSLGRLRSWWGLRVPTALGVISRRGSPIPTLATRLTRTLRAPGVVVSTPAQVRDRIAASTRQGLENLRRLSLLVALAGLITICAVALAATLQRLQRIAVLRAIGAGTDKLAAAASFEIVWCVGVGALLGAATGLLGQRLAVRYLAGATGLPMEFTPHPGTLALAGGIAFAIAACASLLALRVVVAVSPAASLRRV
jgi:putative ABC transport system permease protein